MGSDLSGSGVPLSSGVAGRLQNALKAYSAGRLGETEFYCKLVLAADSRQFDALQLLGQVEFQRGRLNEAVQLLRKAVKANPRSVVAHSNLGLVFEETGRHEDALASIERALAIDPDNVLALSNRGHVLWRLGRPEDALQSLNRALAFDPDYTNALCNRGNVLVELRRFEEALASYDRALAIAPNDPSSVNNRANVLWALERRDEALAGYAAAYALDPNDLSMLKDRGTALTLADRGDEALACFDRALALKPGDVYFTYKRGTALARLNRYDEALACFDQALAHEADNAEALDDRGTVLAALHRAEEAIASYDQALRLKPETPESHWNRGLALLTIGDFEQGWKEYEWRSQMRDYAKPRNFREPLWLGERPLEHKTILLHAEQGFGDTIQFARFVPLIAARGAKVILEVQPELKQLMTQLDGAAQVVGRGETLPPFDFHCPLLSLPHALKTRPDTIPANTPYLSVTPERIDRWRERLPKSDAIRIAIAWGGRADFRDDKTRSIGLPALEPLLSTPGVQFISLQKELRAGDAEILRKHPSVECPGEELADFADTAAILTLADLVISSDTALVHLAGALGRPVWVLLQHTPDWRWSLNPDANPWYPTAKLYRQPAFGDWDSVVKDVQIALQSRLSTP